MSAAPPGLRKRLEELGRLASLLCRLARELERLLGPVTVILYGSYARGDFNAWSDVDLVIVSPGFRGLPYMERMRLLRPIVEESPWGLDVVAWAPEEAAVMLEKPSWRKALQDCILVRDDHGLAAKLQCRERLECPEK